MSRQELADAANTHAWTLSRIRTSLDGNHIGKLERGEHRWPQAIHREAIRAVLHAANDADIGFYITRKSPATTPTNPSEAVVDTYDAVIAHGGSESRRSLLLRGVGVVAAASGLHIDVAGSETRRIGRDDVVRLRAMIALYRSMDQEFGGGALANAVGRFAESASAWLECSYPDALRPSLLSAVASARQFAGWTAFDAGQDSTARSHFWAAEETAVAAGDTAFAAKIRYCQARQLQHLRCNQDALHTLRLARNQLGAAATAAVAAMLSGAEAASLAALGEDHAAIRALGQAQDSFDRIGDNEPDWMSFYGPGELLAQYGRVYRDLARRNPKRYGSTAVGWVRDAVTAFGPHHTRSTLLNKVGVCSALLLADEPEEAVTTGMEVIVGARELTSQRVHHRVTDLRRDLVRYRHLPAVATFARAIAVREVPAR